MPNYTRLGSWCCHSELDGGFRTLSVSCTDWVYLLGGRIMGCLGRAIDTWVYPRYTSRSLVRSSRLPCCVQRLPLSLLLACFSLVCVSIFLPILQTVHYIVYLVGAIGLTSAYPPGLRWGIAAYCPNLNPIYGGVTSSPSKKVGLIPDPMLLGSAPCTFTGVTSWAPVRVTQAARSGDVRWAFRSPLNYLIKLYSLFVALFSSDSICWPLIGWRYIQTIFGCRGKISLLIVRTVVG